MSIVKLKDGSEFYMPTEDADRLAEARNDGAKMIDLRRFELGVRWLDPMRIAEIKDGGVDPRMKRLPAPEVAPMTDEQLARARKFIADGKRKFLARKGMR